MNQPPTPEPMAKLSLQNIEANECCSRLSKLDPHKSTYTMMEYHLHAMLKTTTSIVASPCAQSSTHLEKLSLLSNPYISEAHEMSYATIDLFHFYQWLARSWKEWSKTKYMWASKHPQPAHTMATWVSSRTLDNHHPAPCR